MPLRTSNPSIRAGSVRFEERGYDVIILAWSSSFLHLVLDGNDCYCRLTYTELGQHMVQNDVKNDALRPVNLQLCFMDI